MSEQTGKIIIRGVTRDGRKFRPGDWAQRLTTAVARPGPKGRIRFHPQVAMTTVDGIDCVVIDRDLKKQDPMLFGFLTNFARFNDLEVEEI